MSKYASIRLWWLAAALLGGTLLGITACQCQNGPSTAPSPGDDGTAPSPQPTGPPIYEDVTRSCGIDFTYRNGQEAGHFAILESLGGGVALFDYDGDGLLDIFVTGGGYYDGPDKKEIKGYPCRLYKNLGNFKFRDVTKEVGLDTVGGKPWFYTHGAAVADYDRDGFRDLLVTGYGRVALFHNEPDENAPGGRRFVDVSEKSGLLKGGHIWATSAAWADFDGDGYPDLYICQYVNWSFDPKLGIHPMVDTKHGKREGCKGYRPGIEQDVCPPKTFESRPHRLYRNNGGHTFTDVSKEAGLRTVRTEADYEKLDYLDANVQKTLRDADARKDYGKGLGVVVLDVNGDHKPDIYVADDTTNKLLYLNRSTPGHFRFEEVGLECGVAVNEQAQADGSMGVDGGDPFGSGRPALWVTNYERETHGLYRNEGSADERPGSRYFFQFATSLAGINAAFRQDYVGWGTGFVDLDNHGWEDLVISNGHVIRFPDPRIGIQHPAFLLRNKGGGHFENVSALGSTYYQQKHCARGLAIGDLNNDGLPDLVISHVNEPIAVLRNISTAGNHWLGVELRGKERRDVVGARVTLEAGGRTQARFAKGGCSYASTPDRRLVFGLGQETKVGRLTVEWPTGEPREQSWENLPLDRYWRVVQGQSQPEALPGDKGRRVAKDGFRK
jgi:hypothetical protein